jgi:hypothetical protein
MANRHFMPFEGALDEKTVHLCGFLSITAAAAIDTTNSFFNGGAFAPGATGIYTLTLKDAYPKIMCVTLTVLKAAAADSEWELVSVSGVNGVAVGTVITMRHKKSSDGSAVAPAAVCGVMINVWCKNTPR